MSNDFLGGSDSKASAYNAGDPGSILGLGRSPGEGKGNPLQHSCLENPMDGGAWWATVHGVAKSRTQLSDFTSLCQIVIEFSMSSYQHFNFVYTTFWELKRSSFMFRQPKFPCTCDCF